MDGLMAGGGVIDPDYRGEIKVIMYNLNIWPYTISHDQKIAQVVVEKCHNLSLL
jgi:dUTP pyrophosphatase